MWTKKISNRIHSLGRNEQLYIVPTLDGLKLVILNLILLIIGLVYANNYVLLFNFILFCLFLGSMYYTHFNLQGLKLTSAKFTALHVLDSGTLTLHFKTKSTLGHYFLRAKFNSDLIKQTETSSIFSFESNSQHLLRVDIPVTGIKRGSSALTRITIETLFPFHLFRCFVYFRPNLNIVVFPEKKNLQIHIEKSSSELRPDDGDDFVLSEFKIGDPLKRVHWKKLAQTNKWYSKNLIAPHAAPVMLSIESDIHSTELLERNLSSLCFSLYKLHMENIDYGITLGNIVISPGHSRYHLVHCLNTLANYEV